MNKKQMKEQRVLEVRQELKTLLENSNHKAYTKLLHVSQSGMLRSIEVYTEDGTNITDLVAELCGYTFHKTGGLRVTGVGMDMGFHVVYDLSFKLYCEEGYTREGAYKLNHSWL